MGEPCRYGHDGERYTHGGMCVRCGADLKRKAYWRDPEKILVRQRAAYYADPEKARARRRKSRKKWLKQQGRQGYGIGAPVKRSALTRFDQARPE
jgi:hypothetical protein